MSAVLSTTRPPISLGNGAVLTAPDTSAVLQSMLVAETIRDLRAAIMRDQAVNYSDGSPPVLARDAVMASIIGSKFCESLLADAMRASVEKDARAGSAWETFLTAAITNCSYELVERMADGQRITFGVFR
jgi:hypothetical protein